MVTQLQARVACALNEVAEDLLHVGNLLRRDLHLMLLLVYGIGALSSGLVIGVNFSIGSAIFCSACAYIFVTFAVLRAAEATRGSNADLEATSNLPKICLGDITRAISDMPVEKFVADADLDGCSVQQLRSMLTMKRPSNGSDAEWARAIRDPNIERTELLQYVRKYKSTQSDMCAICYEDYATNDVLKVLPRCGHRFHPQCVEAWARTFVTSPSSSRSCSRKGCPTCPLCNDKISIKVKEA